MKGQFAVTPASSLSLPNNWRVSRLARLPSRFFVHYPKSVTGSSWRRKGKRIELSKSVVCVRIAWIKGIARS
jgi:hypothetical protein